METLIELSEYKFTDLSSCFKLTEDMSIGSNITYSLTRLDGKVLWFPELQSGCCFNKFNGEVFRKKYGKTLHEIIASLGLKSSLCNMVHNSGKGYLSITTSSFILVYTSNYDVSNIHHDIHFDDSWVPCRSFMPRTNKRDPVIFNMDLISFVHSIDGMTSDYWQSFVRVK